MLYKVESALTLFWEKDEKITLRAFTNAYFRYLNTR